MKIKTKKNNINSRIRHVCEKNMKMEADQKFAELRQLSGFPRQSSKYLNSYWNIILLFKRN